MTDMATYKQHQDWWEKHETQADDWIQAIVSEDDPVELSDRLVSGGGRHRSPHYPQTQATPAQATSMQAGWLKMLDKAREDIIRITEEFRLADYVARHQLGETELAAIISMMRRRYYDKGTDDDGSQLWHDGNS